MGYRCVYLPTSLATMIFKTESELILSCQFIVNLIGCARRSDVFEDPSKFSQSSLCSLAFASELIMERQRNVMGIQEKY
jgi:hypothetical protein